MAPRRFLSLTTEFAEPSVFRKYRPIKVRCCNNRERVSSVSETCSWPCSFISCDWSSFTTVRENLFYPTVWNSHALSFFFGQLRYRGVLRDSESSFYLQSYSVSGHEGYKPIQVRIPRISVRLQWNVNCSTFVHDIAVGGGGGEGRKKKTLKFFTKAKPKTRNLVSATNTIFSLFFSRTIVSTCRLRRFTVFYVCVDYRIKMTG